MNGTNEKLTAAADQEVGHAVGAGAMKSVLPTADETKEFAAALVAARERFIQAALAEDGMPVSAGRVVAEREPAETG